MTTREELAWALAAVLPHVGTHYPLDVVGIDLEKVYASDKYTVGVATVSDILLETPAHLPVSEAKDLLRFVKPQRVPEKSQEVKLVVAPTDSGGIELHVGFDDQSEVYNLRPMTDMSMSVGFLEGVFDTLYEAWGHEPIGLTPLRFDPDFTVRFQKAKRTEMDTLVMYPSSAVSKSGIPYLKHYVEVGQSFRGAIAGMSGGES